MKKIWIIYFLIPLFCGAQTQTIIPMSSSKKLNTVSFSVNEEYAVLSNTAASTYHVSYSLFDLHKRRVLKNAHVRFEKMYTLWGISNSATHIEFHNSGGDHLFISSSSGKKVEKEGLKKEERAIWHQDIHELFFPEDDYMNHSNYWFSKHYAVSLNKDKVIVYDSIKKQRNDYPKKPLKGLSSFYKNEVSVSKTGDFLAYTTTNKVIIYDLKNQSIVWESDQKITQLKDIAVYDNNIICIAGNMNKNGFGLYWIDFKQNITVDHSSKSKVAAIPYVSQFYKYLSLGLGDEDKNGVQRARYIDLSTGLSYNKINGSGWKTFNQVQAYVKDTLSRNELSQNEFDSINSRKVYFRYFEMRNDYLDKEENYQLSISNPQVTEDFFNYIENDSSINDLQVFTADQNRVSFQNTSGDLPFFGLSPAKRLVYFWNGNMSEKERLVYFVFSHDDKPIFFTPDNYYYFPEGYSDAVGFELDKNYYPIEQFDIKYHRPDIILKRLGYADSVMITAYHRAYLKRLKKLNLTEDDLKEDAHIPHLEIKNTRLIPAVTDSASININLHLWDEYYELDRIQVWINDVAIYGSSGIDVKNLSVQELHKNISIPLVKGMNRISISVMNQSGLESYKSEFQVSCKQGKEKPDLYLITIGDSRYQQSEYNLNFAANDANAIAKLMLNSPAYGKVNVKKLTDEQVTKENILALKSFLKQADMNDEVLIFMAGHGVLNSDLDYFLATYPMDFEQPSKFGLAYDELESLLDGIKPLKKTLLIDACHSGEIDKDEVEQIAIQHPGNGPVKFRAVGESLRPKLGLQNTQQLNQAIFSDLRKGTGATVISSSGGMEFAMEGEEWSNGLFTYCLLYGIKSGEADQNKDGEIWLSELKNYVERKVMELSDGLQQPTSRIENQTIDCRIW